MVNKYSFNIEWSEEDQEYVATSPSFPTLIAFGRTEEEALAEGKTALKGFIETCRTNNITLPDSHVRETFSGKLQLRLVKSLHRLAARFAAAEGVSLNTYIADAVRAKVSNEQFGERALNAVRTAVAAVVTMPANRTTTQYTKETETILVQEGTALTVKDRRHKEVLAELIKRQKIHKGRWMLVFELTHLARNVPAQKDGTEQVVVTPATITLIQRVGIAPTTEVNDLTLDASEVNPPHTRRGKSSTKRRARK